MMNETKREKYKPKLFVPPKSTNDAEEEGAKDPNVAEQIFDEFTQITKQEKHELSWDDLEVSCPLGQGASASVFKLKNKTNGHIYARKQVKVEKHESPPKTIVSEFKSLYETDCPHIVKLYDTFFREGSIYMILEFMDCGSLADLIKICNHIPESIIGKITPGILKGLDYLHTKKNIVHRDIKPPNILVNQHGEIKIADFGMAGFKTGEAQQNKSNVFETFQGTMTYMSPERIKGKPHSFNSDVWSVGLTLAECALGKFPFDIKEVNIWEVLKQVERNSVPTLLTEEEFTPEFRSFIGDCMKYNQEERPSTSQLLSHPFVKKYEKTEPSLKRWIFDNYIRKRKAAAAAKK